jgi:hypothetical protein
VSAPVEQGRSAETSTAAEISRAVGSLTTAQKTALVKIAKAYAWKTRYGHEDLIQTADGPASKQNGVLFERDLGAENHLCEAGSRGLAQSMGGPLGLRRAAHGALGA